MIRVFETFSGYGGATFALRQAGIAHEVVGWSEIEPNAIKAFHQNHTGAGPNLGDITKIDWNTVPDFDLLTGGFPCQDVSNAGQQDLSKGRSNLGFELTKALVAKQPSFFLFENVKGILSGKFDIFRIGLLRSWQSAGYYVHYKVLNSKDFGIPQNRERVWFVGIRKDIHKPLAFQFPKGEPLKLRLRDVLETEVDQKYYLKPETVAKLMKRAETVKAKGFGFASDFMPQDPYGVSGSLKAKGDHKNVANALRARDWKEPPTIACLQIDSSGKNYHSTNDRFYDTDGIAPTINGAPDHGNIMHKPKLHELTSGMNEAQRIYDPDGLSRTIKGGGGQGAKTGLYACSTRTRSYKGQPEQLELTNNEFSNSVTSLAKDSLVMNCLTEAQGRLGSSSDYLSACNSIRESIGEVRRLSPREAFRLMGFLNDEINLDGIAETHRYKLAGNGWCLRPARDILTKLIREYAPANLPAFPKEGI